MLLLDSVISLMQSLNGMANQLTHHFHGKQSPGSEVAIINLVYMLSYLNASTLIGH
jgi:hypothetical protein